MESDYRPVGFTDSAGQERDAEYRQFLKKLPKLTSSKMPGVQPGVPEATGTPRRKRTVFEARCAAASSSCIATTQVTRLRAVTSRSKS